MTRGVLASAAVALLAAAAWADATDDALAKARAGLVSRLESVLAWAEDQRISGFRHRVARLVLEVAPDHARARGLLKFRRASKQAPWTQDPKYQEPGNGNLALLPEAEGKVAAALGGYREAVLAAVGDDAARRDAELERLLDMAPEDVDVRRLLGHVEEGGRWALPETHRALAARASLVAAGEAARAKALRGAVVDAESLAKGWTTAYRIGRRRALGSLEQPLDARETLVMADAADAIARRVFGTPKDSGLDIVYLFDTRDDARSFLRQKSEENAEALRKIEKVSALPLSPDVHLSILWKERKGLTSAARSVVGDHLWSAFRGQSRGWVTEGFGQRIVWYATGVHGRYFVNLEGTDTERAADEEKVPDDPAEWLPAAARVLGRPDAAPRLAALLTARLNAMRSSDVLLAYALAAYLVEGRPESLHAFVKASQTSDDATAVVRQVLDLDVRSFAGRLRRWLKDTTPAPGR